MILDDLRRSHRRRPKVTDLPGTLQVSERSESLLDARIGIGSVKLEEVNDAFAEMKRGEIARSVIVFN